MGMAERITHAQLSGNLSEAKTADELADVDVIRALGMIAANNPLGSAIWRVKYAQVESLLPYVVESLIELAVRLGIAETFDEAREALGRVIPYWLDDTCHECEGRGYMVVPGTPMLSDKACRACSGRGRLFHDSENKIDQFLLDELSREEATVSIAVWRRLGR